MNLFEKAIKSQLRFIFNGPKTIEEIFALRKARLTTSDKNNLWNAMVKYEQELDDEVTNYGKTSRRHSDSKTTGQKDAELRLALITTFLDEWKAEDEASTAAMASKAELQELFDLKKKLEIDAKSKLSLEEVNAMIAAKTAVAG